MKVLLQLPDFYFIVAGDKYVVDIKDHVDQGVIYQLSDIHTYVGVQLTISKLSDVGIKFLYYILGACFKP